MLIEYSTFVLLFKAPILDLTRAEERQCTCFLDQFNTEDPVLIFGRKIQIMDR